MIRSIRHNGLQALFEQGSRRGVGANEADKLLRIMRRLNRARVPADLNVQGYHLHQLSGDRAGTWSIRVTRNWRLTFRLEDYDVYDVDYEDYH